MLLRTGSIPAQDPGTEKGNQPEKHCPCTAKDPVKTQMFFKSGKINGEPKRLEDWSDLKNLILFFCSGIKLGGLLTLAGLSITEAQYL